MMEFTSEFIAEQRKSLIERENFYCWDNSISLEALDHIERLQQRIAELEQERRVYCTEDGIYPLKGDDVFFQLEDGKTHIGYYTENEGSVFISNNSSYAFWVEEEKIYWKLFENLQESYEQQADLPQPPKDGE